jgi:hypothetical protein
LVDESPLVSDNGAPAPGHITHTRQFPVGNKAVPGAKIVNRASSIFHPVPADELSYAPRLKKMGELLLARSFHYFPPLCMMTLSP